MVTSRVACERRHENFIPPPKFQTFGNFWKFDSVFSSFRIDLRQMKYSFELFYRLWTSPRKFHSIAEIQTFGNFWKFDPFSFLFRVDLRQRWNIRSNYFIGCERRLENFIPPPKFKLLEIGFFLFLFALIFDNDEIFMKYLCEIHTVALILRQNGSTRRSEWRLFTFDYF